MIDKLYDWMMKQAESKYAVYTLVLISFLESSFFPFPPDPVLGIIVAKNKNRVLFYAIACTVASVLGGLLGYYIGYAFFELIGSRVLSLYGQLEAFENMIPKLNQWAFWIICVKGLTPIPYKVVTITSGFARIDLCTFVVASIIARGARFVIFSLVCRKYGEQILNFVEKNKKLIPLLIIFGIVVGFLLIKLFAAAYEASEM